jgi:hypothetical protein
LTPSYFQGQPLRGAIFPSGKNEIPFLFVPYGLHDPAAVGAEGSRQGFPGGADIPVQDLIEGRIGEEQQPVWE